MFLFIYLKCVFWRYVWITKQPKKTNPKKQWWWCTHSKNIDRHFAITVLLSSSDSFKSRSRSHQDYLKCYFIIAIHGVKKDLHIQYCVLKVFIWDLGVLIASQTLKVVVSSAKDFDNTTLIVVLGTVIQAPLPVIAARADLQTLLWFQGRDIHTLLMYHSFRDCMRVGGCLLSFLWILFIHVVWFFQREKNSTTFQARIIRNKFIGAWI